MLCCSCALQVAVSLPTIMTRPEAAAYVVGAEEGAASRETLSLTIIY